MFYFNKWYFIKITNVTKFSLYYFYVIYWALHFLFLKISSSKVIKETLLGLLRNLNYSILSDSHSSLFSSTFNPPQSLLD